MSLTRLSPLCLSWAFEKHKRRKKTKQDKIDKHIRVFHDLKLHWIRNLHEILFGLISLWNCSCSCFKPQDFAWNSKFVASTFWLLKRQILFVKEYFTPFIWYYYSVSTFKNSNELIVKLNQYFILAFVAEVGDYDHDEHGDGAGYLSEFKFCPKQVVRCVMIVKQTFGLVSKGFNLQKPRATYTSQNGVFTERVRWHMCWRALKGIGIPD